MKNKKRVSEDRPQTLQPSPSSSIRWWQVALGFLTVCVVAFQAYSPALRGDFVFDDVYLPFFEPSAATLPLGSWMGLRPFLMFSYWANFQMSGLHPFPYHVLNVLLHIVNAVLAGLIVRRFLVFVREEHRVREVLSIFAGMLFLLHPVQTESVAYIAGRSESLSILFVLSAVAVFLYRETRSITPVRMIVVLVLYGIGCSVKEHVVVLPVLLALTDYYFNSGFDGLRRNARLYIPLLVIGAVAGFAVVNVLRGSASAGFALKDITWYTYLFTQFRVLWLYLRLYVLPFSQNGDYDMSLSQNILDGGALFGLFGLLVLAVLAWKYRKEYPLASYGYFGFLILLAPTSSIVPIKDVAVERRLYLPFFCLLLITVDFVRRWKASRTVVAGTLLSVSALAGVLTYQRNEVWRNNFVFWEDVLRNSPNNRRARFQLAYAYYQNGKCAEAAERFKQLASTGAPERSLLIDWGLALECSQQPDAAIAKLREAAQFDDSAHPWAQIGMIYGKRGDAPKALEALAAAEKADPRFDMLYVYRGNVYASQGNYPGALAEYRKALEIAPSNTVARDAIPMIEAQMKP